MLHQPADHFRPSASGENDRVLVDATEALRAARIAYNESPEDSALEASYGDAERAAFGVILKTPAVGYAGLAAKVRVLLTEKSGGIDYLDEAAVEAEIAAGVQYNEDRAAFSLALDILRLAREERKLQLLSERAA